MAGKSAGGEGDGEVMRLALRRTAEMAAVFMIGDGLLGLLQPARHVALWRSDVAPVDALVRPFAGHAGRRRAYGLLQLGAGVLLAARLHPVARTVAAE